MNGLVASELIALKAAARTSQGHLGAAENPGPRPRDLVPEAESLVFSEELNKEMNGFRRTPKT